MPILRPMISDEEITQREIEFNTKLDEKHLSEFEEKQDGLIVGILDDIRFFCHAGKTYKEIGRMVRKNNPQLFLYSKYLESVTRAVIKRIEDGLDTWDNVRS